MNGPVSRLLRARPRKGCVTSVIARVRTKGLSQSLYFGTHLKSAAVEPVAGGVAAVDRDHDAIDIVRSVRCQKPTRPDHVRRLAPPARRRPPPDRLFKRLPPTSFAHLGKEPPGRCRVHLAACT